MTAPLYEFGLITENASLAIAIGLGVAFGFFLERGGLGNANKLAAQFYLTDLAVLKSGSRSSACSISVACMFSRRSSHLTLWVAWCSAWGS